MGLEILEYLRYFCQPVVSLNLHALNCGIHWAGHKDRDESEKPWLGAWTEQNRIYSCDRFARRRLFDIGGGGDCSDFDDCRSLYKRQPINNRHRRIVNRLHYDTGVGEGRSPSFKNCATDPDKWKFAIPARTLINQYQSSARCDYIINEKKFTYGVINQDGIISKKIFFYLLYADCIREKPHTFSRVKEMFKKSISKVSAI